MKNPLHNTPKKVLDLLSNPKSQGCIIKKSTVIIAVSGGPDSVFLLHLVKKLEKKLHLQIIAAHINHKLRGSESDADERFVKNLCKKLKIKFETSTLPAIKKGNIEEIARDFRYSFFSKLQKKYKATHILTAHHADDNIETVLMNMTRGSFARGLKGMDFHGGVHRNVLRPLLHLTKEDILQYLKKHRLAYRIDKSNTDEKYSRNFIRHQIIPLFKKLNPNFAQTFQRNLQLFGEVDNTLSTLSKSWLAANFMKNECLTSIFTEQPPLFQECILTELYQQNYGHGLNLSNQHLESVKALITQNISGKKKEFGSKYFLVIKRNTHGKKVMKLETRGSIH
ncbi:tRNA lysidine(34) synthetase TilS [Candidatus Peregrinibacteria bacterium]|nr:tRNA lysidine(34) synthetase TilS [Candidatus Peregrinibacteria bacterium]